MTDPISDDERTLQWLGYVEDVYMPWSDCAVEKLAEAGFAMRDPELPEYAVLTPAGRAELDRLRKLKGVSGE